MSRIIQASDSSSEKSKFERPWNAPKYLKQKKENKDLEVYQQAILIGLLNQYSEITLERPAKLSKVTVISPKVSEIKFCKEDTLDVSSLVERQCKAKLSDEINKGLNEATALRRMEKNKKVFVQNLLIDLLDEFGFQFHTTLSRRSGKAMQVERIQKIFSQHSLLLTKEEIIQKGQELNSYLFQFIEHNGSYSFKKGEIQLVKAFV
ncbi:hypothetical protein EDI_002530 [Entamoeba dispar SAW760]|uniref:Uncharacterized protein n=1 Tax=Entamoeba dispar (strain ATCC PRA-260 / SAW760) TaxID=370354 RepID=B0EJ82_ENTDS|nr:uncharacterized protein EDI_002530 [Entamoeba dispar SAW760]EDR25390.1 hypothetical protein EDI_002530 [Entamoeba dispar SAW760]|eukprot:EDR25390.1 hypothetical protein EDI_002530 [Entamoeba dispar SAW760]